MRRDVVQDELRLESLVAHRQMQLARARSGGYFVKRQRKLDEAVESLARVRRRLAELT